MCLPTLDPVGRGGWSIVRSNPKTGSRRGASGRHGRPSVSDTSGRVNAGRKPTKGRWLVAVDCFAEVAKSWLEPAIAAAGPLYFAVPHASVLIKAPPDFSNTVLQVHKNIMAA